MKLSNKKSVQQIVLTLSALGLREVVISPGSRNAPLIISFNRHPEINCTVIRDERSAAFFALGKALELNEPVAIVCTSGSAVLNYAPAIVEAYYLRVPLIVITADRPEIWIGQGDGQTIDQKNIYSNYIRKNYLLDGDTEDENILLNQVRSLAEGYFIATEKDRGPVHFNVFFNEPLFGLAEAPPFQIPQFPELKNERNISDNEIEKLQNSFANSKKVMVLVGQMATDKMLNDLLIQLSQFNNTIVLSESTANIHHPNFIENIDRCIMPMKEEELKDFFPDILITFGGAIVSKKIKAVLRKYKPNQHWNVHPYDAKMNTYQSLTHPIALDTVTFLERFLPKLKVETESDYKSKWIQWSSLLEEKHNQYVHGVAYSDFWVFSEILKKVPTNTNLHLGNSSPIRYAQLFDNRLIKNTHCNRGTSGIDGCTSTAMGAASAKPDQPYLLITGDVSFFYDSNAFWNDHTPENLKIIVINNSGGGIFRIIKGPSEVDELETYFETKHNRSAKKLVDFNGWNYLSANSKETLQVALVDFLDKDSKKTVLEIFTPRELNPTCLAEYFKYLEIN
ncbi:MAG: 2-succinyl-5-enolpyruvyl-6-hydroxy-3-cyclohexene-1-carboxylic-acid synthase [Ginsengibacter sp.]|jgi:2-succinyl-5-enolpyruvyl-6-hydroxy-3-cyclohexene-1-carboxylate synthase